MKKNTFLSPMSFYGKISAIVTAGILLTAFLTLDVAYRGAQRISMEHYIETGKTNMEHVKNLLLETHTHISTTYDHLCNSDEVRAAFTISPAATSAEQGERILAAQKQIGGLWNLVSSSDTVLTAMGENGFSFSSDGWGLRISRDQFLDSPVLRACRESPYVLQYVPLPESMMGGNRTAPSLVAVRSLKTPMGKTPFGILLIQFSQAYFNDICKPFNYPQSHFLITDAKGRILSRGLPEEGAPNSGPIFFPPFSSMLLQNSFREEGMCDHVKMRDTENVVLYRHVPYMDLYLINVIDKKKIAEEFYSSISGALLLAGLLTAAILFLTALITGGITKPLKRFTAQLFLAYGGQHETRLPVEGSYETRQLARAYNHMADEIKCYNEKLMAEEKKRHKAELMALQFQINPHFLYNTLAGIRYLALKGKSDLAGQAIQSLIGMLRDTLGKTEEFVTVEAAMKNLKNYTNIMSLCYDNAIQVYYAIHPGCLNTLMPRLLLQPLVENAFFHAFSDSEGYIKILASQTRQGRLLCEIIDNGRGFDVQEDTAQTEAQPQAEGHIGLSNVGQRLFLIYGESASFTVSSRPGMGTIIKIELPTHP